MGFNLRYLSKEKILETLENNDSLVKLFTNDAIILEDDFSTEVHNLLSKGVKEEEVINIIKNDLTKN